MKPIKLNHFAFNEGMAGYHNGCARNQNPYADETWRAENPRQWDRGWAHAEQIAFEQARQARHERQNEM